MKALKLVPINPITEQRAMEQMDRGGLQEMKDFYCKQIQKANDWVGLMEALGPSFIQAALKVNYDGLSSEFLIDVIEEEGVFKTII